MKEGTMNARKEEVELITARIFERFFQTYDRKLIDLSYDIANLAE